MALGEATAPPCPCAWLRFGVARVRVVNPLPRALMHYERELLDVLTAVGVDPRVDTPAISAEMHGASRVRKARRALHMLRLRLRREKSADALVVAWPVFGYADPLSWRWARVPVWLIVHDPEPLRPQIGMGRVGMLAGRHVRNVRAVAHTRAAAEIVAKAGRRAEVLPHPILRPPSSPARSDRSDDGAITVVGQWKPARSLVPLVRLAEDVRWTGRRVVRGRGWPDIDGWDVVSRFQTEAELDAAIRKAACVLVPYTLYFQSNVAVRCLERLVPVVGHPHPFLTELYGEDWPGLVGDQDDWPAAVARACEVPVETLDSLRAQHWDRCTEAWRRFAEMLTAA